jgi:hypothetical protein
MRITVRLKAILLFFFLTQAGQYLYAQNIFSGEPVQVVGAFNGYVTTPYNADYRTTQYRRMTVASGTPVDGRGQWTTIVNVQNSGGDVTPINMPGGASNGFLFISGPAANRFQNKWVFSGVGQAAVDGINNISCFNCGNDMGLNMNTPGRYTFVFSDAGYTGTNVRFYVGYTTNAPVQPTRTSELLNPDASSTITINLSAAPSPQEKVYVRYTLGADFASTGTSSVVEASLSGSDYVATIPAQTGGVVVRYYVFTSTRTLAQLNASSESERNISALRYDDNSGGNFFYVAGSLPVTLSSFTGSALDGKIRIRWITEQEINMDKYELYKSSNGVAFNLIATVPAQNGSASRHEYEHLDRNPSSSGNYYKLISIGRDGKRSVTRIIRVHYLAIDNSLAIYPNPVKDQLNIGINGLVRGSYRINIYSDLGQLVYTQPFEHNGYDKTLNLVLPATIKKGPYRLYISNKYEFYKSTFIVQ